MLTLLAVAMLGQVQVQQAGADVGPPVPIIDFSTAVCTAGYRKVTCNTGGAGGAPTNATYITQTADATLTNEQALSSLSTGLMSVTTGTGVVSNYAGATCGANQYATQVSATGALTCSQVAYSQLTGAPSGSTCGSGFAYSINASGVLTCSIADPTVGGTGLTTIDTNEIAVGTAADTMAAKLLPSCSNAITSKLLYNDSTQTFSCGTDQTGGGAGSGKSVEASIDLTAAGYFSTSVSLASTASTDMFVCRPFGTTADGLTPEAIAVANLQATVSNLVAGVGFTIHVYSPYGLKGLVRIHCTTGG